MKKIKMSSKIFAEIAGIALFGIVLIAVTVLLPSFIGAAVTGALIFTPGLGFGEMRGSSGYQTTSKNHYGGFMRIKVKPINPNTSYQTVVRDLLKDLSKSWKGLTQAVQLDYMNLAKQMKLSDRLGRPMTLTGEALFIQLNMNLVLAGGTELTTCPALSANVVANIAGTSVAIAAGVPTLTWGVAIPADHVLEVQASPALSAGIHYNSKFKTVIYEPAAAAGNDVITVEYTAKIGTPAAAGNVTFFRWRVVNKLNGFASQYVSQRVIAT
jgi:hypothetical protein